jgi:hypothetical protein
LQDIILLPACNETDLPEITAAETPFYEITICCFVSDFINNIDTSATCPIYHRISVPGGKTGIK